MKTSRVHKSKGRLGKLMVIAPVVLEVLHLMRQSQRKGKYVKARKRDKALDFLLNQARRRMGGKSARRF
ncbi:hypothetical protein [Deinococcus hohokamensis]|uniref:Transposase n=1 Tax=Deinococcus hohokamensis TaxID=309883 RepID=A0ABV9IC27_9DEIO